MKYDSRNKILFAFTILELGILGITTIVYGKIKYYKGKIDKYNEFKIILDAQQELIKDLINERSSH